MNETLENGSVSTSELQNLQKALSVGYEHGVTDQTGFGATRLQSIEKTLKWAVEDEKQSKFWLALRKSKAESTVEEYTKFNSLGDASFYVEGGIPEEYNEGISREFEMVKYIGAVGQIPLVALSVKSQTNNEALVMKAKATAIIRACNLKSIFGNSNNISIEWNGYVEQFLRKVKNPAQNTFDLRGRVLSPENMADAAQVIADNWGDSNNLKFWISNGAFKNYAKELIKNKTYFVNGKSVNEIVAVPKTLDIGDNGAGHIETEKHLKFRGQTNINDLWPRLNSNSSALAATSTKAPATLSSGTAIATVTTDAASLLDANTYDYCFIPVNAYGAGAGFEVKGVVVAANKNVTFTLSDNGSTTGYEASCFEVYRKNASALSLTDYRFLATYAASAAKVDNGADIPGTEIGLFIDWNPDQVIDFKQLLPMVRMDLATISDSKRWLQKYYGTPLLYNANKMVLFKNIGSTPLS